MKWWKWSALVVIATCTIGCKRIVKEIIREGVEATTEDESDGKADLTKPSTLIKLQWVEDDKFQIPGKPDQYGDISVHEGIYKVTLHGMPEGSEFIVDGLKYVVESKIYDIIEVRKMRSLLGKVPVADLRDARLDPSSSAELKIPGKHAKFKLPPAKILGLDDILESVENTPLIFDEEPEKQGTGFSILHLQGLTPNLFGKATLLQDVDGIGLQRRLSEVKGKKNCTGYKDKEKKPAPDITLLLKETEVVIYDRRTSEIVAEKVFPPHDRCPMFAFGIKDDRTQDSYPPREPIEEWLRSQVKR